MGFALVAMPMKRLAAKFSWGSQAPFQVVALAVVDVGDLSFGLVPLNFSGSFGKILCRNLTITPPTIRPATKIPIAFISITP